MNSLITEIEYKTIVNEQEIIFILLRNNKNGYEIQKPEPPFLTGWKQWNSDKRNGQHQFIKDKYGKVWIDSDKQPNVFGYALSNIFG